MTYEELKIQLDINDPVEVLKWNGRLWNSWIIAVVCDDGDCHLFDKHGKELDIKQAKIKAFNPYMVSKGIKKIVVPDGVKRIGEYAFYDYTSLKSIELPSSVKCIGEGAFEQCSSLKSIEVPNSVKSIGYWAFEGCTSLTSIKIPSSVESIGNRAFYSCDSLKHIVFKCKALKQVMAMKDYPWGIKDESTIICA